MNVPDTAEEVRPPVALPVQPKRPTIPATELPTSKESPLGQTLKFIKHQTDYLESCRDRVGPRFRLRLRPGPDMYMISDPDEIRAMFMAPLGTLHTANGNNIAMKFFGKTGLAFLDEEEHVNRRKALMPSFKGSAYQRIEKSILEQARRDVASWPRNEVVSLHPLLHRLTMGVIREVIFGDVVPTVWPEMLDELMGVVHINSQVSTYLEFDLIPPPVLSALTAFKPTGLKKFFAHSKRVDELIAEAVRERMEIGEFGDDLLSMMLAVRKEDGSLLTGTELRDEMMTLFLAGTETTVSSLSWVFEYLSREPVVLDRLRAELDEGTSDAYLTAVTYEVLRLRPPLPSLMPREVMKPIEIGGVRYEKGMFIWASAHLLGTDPAKYENPKAFRPERFLGVKPDMNMWVPFGGGITRCLGDKIALFEMKTVLREVLTTCDLHRTDMTPEKVRRRGVLIMPEHGGRMELRPRARVAAGV